jgi:hypothetical protein
VSLPDQKNHEWLGASTTTQGREVEERKKRRTYSLRSLQQAPESRRERPSDFPGAVGEGQLDAQAAFEQFVFWGRMAAWAAHQQAKWSKRNLVVKWAR